jgi:hypothetical protein
MENTRHMNPDPGNMEWSAFLIEKVHRCADCPIRKLAVKQPQSIFAKLHAWHKTWWPAGKSHQARTCAYAGRVGIKA